MQEQDEWKGAGTATNRGGMGNWGLWWSGLSRSGVASWPVSGSALGQDGEGREEVEGREGEIGRAHV
jgi:hypothetical protein